VTAVIVQGFNVRRIGTESIFGDNKPEMGMVLAQLGNEAFGGMALTLVFSRCHLVGRSAQASAE